MRQQLTPALRAMAFLTLLTGFLYPGVVTGLCQLLFHDKANGSLVYQNGRVVGSVLLGQNFARPEYFSPRPSAAGTDGYDPTASSGSNLGPTSQKLYDRIKKSAEDFRKANPTFHQPIPADALTASASGLDPHISVASAGAQIARVAGLRHVTPQQIEELLRSHTESRDLSFLGEKRINVLALNLALDRQFPKD